MESIVLLSIFTSVDLLFANLDFGSNLLYNRSIPHVFSLVFADSWSQSTRNLIKSPFFYFTESSQII